MTAAIDLCSKQIHSYSIIYNQIYKKSIKLSLLLKGFTWPIATEQALHTDNWTVL